MSTTSVDFTGTLQYPATQLVILARLILTQYEAHLKTKEDAADADDDDDDMRWDAIHSQEDIHELNWLIDRQRWKEKEEVIRGVPVHPVYASDLNDPKQAERGLLTVGANHKASFVFADAIKLRKETREQRSGDSDWKNEDALLDFLLFLSIHEHCGLFRGA